MDKRPRLAQHQRQTPISKWKKHNGDPCCRDVGPERSEIAGFADSNTSRVVMRIDAAMLQSTEDQGYNKQKDVRSAQHSQNGALGSVPKQLGAAAQE
eukprot:m.126256 g.126256  ORF g.126256 m.126256 type:complete len:97 (-) comp9705_c0_seq1:187-477(-)